MRIEVAREIMEVYPRKRLDLASARTIVHAWADASGWERDQWGNYHPPGGRRLKITKRVVQRQQKRSGRWRNLSSTPLVQAANNLVEKAAEVLGDEEALRKARGAKAKRVEKRTKQRDRAAAERDQRELETMALKIVSAEHPEEMVLAQADGRLPLKLQQAWSRTVGQLKKLRELGRMPVDGDLFSSQMPPIAPLIADAEATWVESMRGVPYTISIRHAGTNQAVIEIGSTAGEMSLGTRVDPVTMSVSPQLDIDREGDGYISGRVQRTPRGPVGALFMIISQQKQRGAGSRMLDLWCNLMEAYGVDAWVAEGVGEEGLAFLAAKIRDGRLEELGRQGPNLVMRCIGGPEARQQRLAFNPADVLAFPERPDRLTIGSRTYAVSDIGVPFIDDDADPDEEREDEEPALIGARVIDAGGNRWRYVWVYEPDSDAFEMYRHSDGEWKVLGRPSDYPQTFEELKRLGQLNTVTPDELAEFQAIMRERSEDTLASLKESWDLSKGDEQRRVDELVERFYDERVRNAVERAWDDIDRGVFPFDFTPQDSGLSRERQARMHALQSAMQRAGFTYHEDSDLERYVMDALGYRTWEDFEDPQSVQWAWHDFLDDKVYPRLA